MTKKSTVALIIHPGRLSELKMVTPVLDQLQLIVGGYIEGVGSYDGGGGGHGYIDEDGKSKAYEVNDLATRLVNTMFPGFATRDFIVGTMVFLGDDSKGDEDHVPESQINRFCVDVLADGPQLVLVRRGNDVWTATTPQAMRSLLIERYNEFRNGVAPTDSVVTILRSATDADLQEIVASGFAIHGGTV